MALGGWEEFDVPAECWVTRLVRQVASTFDPRVEGLAVEVSSTFNSWLCQCCA